MTAFHDDVRNWYRKTLEDAGYNAVIVEQVLAEQAGTIASQSPENATYPTHGPSILARAEVIKQQQHG